MENLFSISLVDRMELKMSLLIAEDVDFTTFKNPFQSKPSCASVISWREVGLDPSPFWFGLEWKVRVTHEGQWRTTLGQAGAGRCGTVTRGLEWQGGWMPLQKWLTLIYFPLQQVLESSACLANNFPWSEILLLHSQMFCWGRMQAQSFFCQIGGQCLGTLLCVRYMDSNPDPKYLHLCQVPTGKVILT